MTRSSIEAFRQWAATYDEDANPLLRLEERELTPLLGDLDGARFLDAGCGTGRWLRFAQRAGAAAVGFDLVLEMLRRAPPPAVQADLERPPFPAASFELALCSLTLSYIPNPSRAVAALIELVRPGGRCIVSDLHPDAHAAGWRRTFSVRGRTIEIPSFPSALSAALRANPPNAAIEQRLSAGFRETDRPLFEQLGRLDKFAAATAAPALEITLLRRR